MAQSNKEITKARKQRAITLVVVLSFVAVVMVIATASLVRSVNIREAQLHFDARTLATAAAEACLDRAIRDVQSFVATVPSDPADYYKGDVFSMGQVGKVEVSYAAEVIRASNVDPDPVWVDAPLVNFDPSTYYILCAGHVGQGDKDLAYSTLAATVKIPIDPVFNNAIPALLAQPNYGDLNNNGEVADREDIDWMLDALVGNYAGGTDESDYDRWPCSGQPCQPGVDCNVDHMDLLALLSARVKPPCANNNATAAVLAAITEEPVYVPRGAYFLGGVASPGGNVHGLVTGTLFNDASLMSDLGTLEPDNARKSSAFDINEKGQVVGRASYEGGGWWDHHAYIWESGEMTDLGTLGGTSSSAYGINDWDQVVGSAYTPANGIRAALWEYDGSTWNITDLGKISNEYSSAFASAISNPIVLIPLLNTQPGPPHGWVIGYARWSAQILHAFIWRDGYSMTALHDLIPPGSGWDYLASANGINDAGQIVGWGLREGAALGDYRAYLLTPDPDDLLNFIPTNLGTLPGDSSSGAVALNNNNPPQIVGWSRDGGGTDRAVIWKFVGGTWRIYNLFDELESSVGWTGLSYAVAINDSGFIAGTGMNSDGYEYAVHLTSSAGEYVIEGLGVLSETLPDSNTSSAAGINEYNQVVGTSSEDPYDNRSTIFHGFLYGERNETEGNAGGWVRSPFQVESLTPTLHDFGYNRDGNNPNPHTYTIDGAVFTATVLSSANIVAGIDPFSWEGTAGSSPVNPANLLVFDDGPVLTLDCDGRTLNGKATIVADTLKLVNTDTDSNCAMNLEPQLDGMPVVVVNTLILDEKTAEANPGTDPGRVILNGPAIVLKSIETVDPGTSGAHFVGFVVSTAQNDPLDLADRGGTLFDPGYDPTDPFSPGGAKCEYCIIVAQHEGNVTGYTLRLTYGQVASGNPNVLGIKEQRPMILSKWLNVYDDFSPTWKTVHPTWPP